MKPAPNILLIFADQQRADTIAAWGNPVIRTPALDSLVGRGVSFMNAFTPSPVCVAARCSMIFGQYPARTNCYENTDMPTDGRQTFMAALTRAGYRTHGVGKCHFLPDANALMGFQTRERQEELPQTVEEDDYLQYLARKGFGHVMDPHGVRSEMYYVPQVSPIPAEHHPTQWVGDRSVAFLNDRERKKDPFFLFSSFIHPHPPFCPPPPWHKLYRAWNMPLPHVPERWEDLIAFVNRRQNRYKYRDRGWDLNLLRCLKAYYYASISFVDFQVGRILAALKENGLDKDTLILYTTDHGELLGDYRSFGKRSMHDAASRIPLIAAFPGGRGAGTRTDVPVSLVDVAPTLLAAAGAKPSTHRLDGIDLAESAFGRPQRDTIFSQLAVQPYADPSERAARSIYMAVNRKWKYIYSAPDNREFLFDRIKDPLETRNAWGGPDTDGPGQELKDALLGYLKESGDIAGIESAGWRVFPRLEVPADPDKGLIVQDQIWAKFNLPGYETGDSSIDLERPR